MLRLPPFVVVQPETAEQAVAAWHPEAVYMAGGTDLLPNLKHGLGAPKQVISLAKLPRGGIVIESEQLVVCASTTLSELATSVLVRGLVPQLARAASLVASPQIRNAGTLGGNVLLDTRCLFYNQTAFWRKALGHCLKAEGDWCHVIGGPKTCVAAQSSDTVPVLLGLDASIELLSASGARVLALRDLFRFNGMDHLKLEPGELLTRVFIPKPAAGFRGTYEKLRVRDSIDFPQLGLAISGTWQGKTPTSLDIVVGAAGPIPKPIQKLEAFCGQELTDQGIEAIAELVRKGTRPNEAIHGDPTWRRQMSVVMTRRALTALRDA